MMVWQHLFKATAASAVGSSSSSSSTAAETTTIGAQASIEEGD